MTCFVNSAIHLGSSAGINRYYVATDTVPFRDTFEKLLSRRSRNSSLIRFHDIFPVHTKGCQNNVTECAGTRLELRILSKSSSIFGSKSNFSKLAGYIGDHREANLSRGFKGSKSSSSVSILSQRKYACCLDQSPSTGSALPS